MSREELIELAKAGEFTENPGSDRLPPERGEDDPEPWWDRWLEEVA